MPSAEDKIRTLREALPALRAEWPIASLALFGSRMRDDARPGSDLDVLVEFNGPISLFGFLDQEERLSAITGLRVDLVPADALKPFIGKRVRAEAVPL